MPEKLTIGYPAHFDIRFVIELSKLRVPGMPRLHFVYQSSCTTEILANLRNHTMDCGIVAMPSQYPEISEYTAIPLFRHQLSVALWKSHPLAKKRVLRLDDIKDEPLIFVAKQHNPALHVWLERRCRAFEFSPRIVQEVRHPHEYAAMAFHRIGIGVGFFRAYYGVYASANVAIRAFSGPDLAIETAMIFGEKFNSAPFKAYIASIATLRDSYRREEQSHLPLSA